MGRIKSTKPKGSFYLKPTKNKKGEEPIYLKYFVTGKYARKSTDIWINPDDWDNVHECVKTKNKLSARINANLETIKQKVEEQLHSFSDGIITFDIVQKMMNGEFSATKTKEELFIDYCNKYNQTQYDSEEYGYSMYYNSIKYIKHFEKFLNDTNQSNLTLGKIKLSIILDYRAERLKTLKKTSFNKSISPIIKAVKWAQDNGDLPANIAHPIIEKGYLKLKETTYNPDTEDEQEVHYLNKKQLKKFIEYKPTSNSAKRTEEFKQIFLFSLYSCGLRISDLVTLQWSQIDFTKRTIDKKQVKTKERGKIAPRISHQGMIILNEWKEKNLNEKYVFNLLPKDFDIKDAAKLRKATNCVDRTINQSLNHIGKQIELPFSLTIHVARHTFCVYALSQGLSLHFVSQIMGHSSILATEKTYAKYLESTVENETNKLEELYKEEALAL